MGESQSGGYIVRYLKWIHQLAKVNARTPVYDGYLIEDSGTGPSASAILNQCAAPLAADDPQRSLPGRGVPLAVVNTEIFYPRTGRPLDSNTATNKFALWFLTGASHGWTFQYDYSDAAQPDLEKADLFDPQFPHFVCGPRQPEVQVYMAEKADVRVPGPLGRNGQGAADGAGPCRGE